MSVYRVSTDSPSSTKIEHLNDMILELDGRIAQAAFDINEIDQFFSEISFARQFKRNESLGHTVSDYTDWTHVHAESGYSIWKLSPSDYKYNALNALYFDDALVENRGEAGAEIATTFDKVYLYDGASYNDHTTEAGTEGGTSFNLLSDTGDYLYLGSSATFSSVKFEFQTRSSNCTLKVEYYNASSGDGWQELTALDNNLTDNTSNFESDGRISWTTPGDWSTYSLQSGETAYYWIRISTSTDPITTGKAYYIIPGDSVIALLALSSTQFRLQEWAWCSYGSSIYVTIQNTGATAFEGDTYITSSSSTENLKNFFIYNHEFTSDYEDSTYTPTGYSGGIDLEDVPFSATGFSATNAYDAIIEAHDGDHSHANKSLLDTYTQTEVDLADAVSKKHDSATIGAAPLTISGQEITFNYDTNDFQLSGNNLQIKESGIDPDLIPFSASGFAATTVNDAIIEAKEGDHTHSNKALLDTYTQTEANLADAVSKKHSQNTDTIVQLESATEIVDQFQYTFNAGDINVLEVSSSYDAAQIFTPNKTGTLAKIDFKVYKDGSTSNLIVELRSTSTGQPTSTVLYSTSFPHTDFTASTWTDKTWTLASPYTLTKGTAYAIVFRSSGVKYWIGNNGNVWNYDTDATYYSYYYYADAGVENWATYSNYQAYFKTYMNTQDVINDGELKTNLTIDKYVTIDGRTISDDGTKLDTIEENAVSLATVKADGDISDAISKKHNRSHALNSTSDHSSSITENNLMDADSNGLPADSGLTVTDVSDAVSKKHDAATVAAAPLTLSGQEITFNYDTNDFQLSGNNLQIKESGIDLSLIPFSASGFIADNAYDAIIEGNHSHSNLSILDATQESFTTALKDKLDNIEENADITDVTNVTSALASINVNAHADISSSGVDIEDAVTKKHDSTTVSAAPLTISGQEITFNYDTNDFQLSGNNLQIKESGIDDSSIPFSASGYSASNIHDAIIEAGLASGHDPVTIAGAPLTLSGQQITFNYDTNDFQLSGNNLQIKESGIDDDAIPFSASGFSASTVHDAIVEAHGSSGAHTQNTDTGTTSDSFEVNSDGNGLSIDASAMTTDRTVHGEDIFDMVVRGYRGHKYISIRNHSDWDIMASNSDSWTIDLWVKHAEEIPAISNYNYIGQDSSTSSDRWRLFYTSIGLSFQSTIGGGVHTGYGGTITDIDTWHHIAMCKVANEFGVYLDGNQVGYGTMGSPGSVDGRLIIGALKDYLGLITQPFFGGMDELRIQHSNPFGAAPNSGKTDTITVPTGEHTSDSNTKLLMHFTEELDDDGNTGHTPIPHGVEIDRVDYKFGSYSAYFAPYLFKITDEGTNDNEWWIGDGNDSNKYLYIRNGDANEPGLRYNASTNKWQFSNDGTTWNDIGTSTGAYTDLSNLTATAINLSLISDSNGIDDLGSGSNRWKDVYLSGNLSDNTNTVSVAQLKTAYDNNHSQSHAIDSASDHTSSITQNNLIDADANGLPDDSGLSVADTSDAISKKHSQNTDTGTSGNSFDIGDGADTNKTIFANNGDGNKPALRYNASTNKWQFANDGVSFSDMGAGGGASQLSDLSDVTFDSGTPTGNQVLTYNAGEGKWKAATPGAASATSGTFTNGDLSAGILTITHSLSLSAPYSIIVVIFDNNGKQIIPDDVTGSTNSVAVDLNSYGTLSGTWGYRYI